MPAHDFHNASDDKKTILLVEDEALIAINEAALLEKHGFEVITAYNAEKAIKTVQENNIDLILMDIDLGKGKMDGNEAAEIILGEQELPIVFLTSHTEKEMVDKVKGITRYGYVLKNCGEFVLIESINMAFELFRAHQKEQESLKRFSTIFNQAAVGIAQVSPDGRFVDVNDKFCDIVGYSKKELLNLKNKDINHPADVNIDKDYIKEVLAGERDSYSIEKRFVHKDGTTIWIQLESKVVRDEHGEVQYAVGIMLDITERKRADETLRVREEQFRAIADYTYNWEDWIGVDGKLIWVNPAVERVTGYTPEECYAMSDYPYPLVHPEDIETAKQEITEGLHEETAASNREFRCICKNGTVKWISVNWQPIYDSSGQHLGTRSSMSDITRRKESEEKYRLLFENAPLPYQSLDGEGRFIEVNPAWLEALGGYEREEVIGKSFTEFIHPDSIKEFRRNLDNFKKKGSAKENIYKMRKKNGEYIEAAFQGKAAYSPDGTFFQTHCVFENISEVRLLENRIREEKEFYERILETVHDGIWVTDKNDVIIYANDAMTGIAGVEKEQLVNKNVLHNFREETITHFKQHYTRAKNSLQQVEYEAQVITPSGRETVQQGWLLPLVKNGKCQGIICTIQDITERKEAENELRESKERYQALVDNSPFGIVEVDEDGNILSINKNVADSIGFDVDSLIDKNMADLLPAEGINDRRKYCLKALRENAIQEFEEEQNGMVLHHIIVPMIGGEKPTTQIITEDITGKKHAEQKLNKSLEEKDFLMKELNHRIKNNLAMIASLVGLKDSALGNVVDLSDITRQIDAIKIVHEKLYQSDEITHIDFRDYIQELLSTVFSFAQREVEIENKSKDVTMRTRTAIPVGLIVNEIATNAIKHGFTLEEARFTIDLQEDETNNQYILTLSNTGNPFPEDIEIDYPDTLGLQLVSALVEQLEGTLELQREPHPVFTIRFPMPVE